jgi:ribA/ribD-fused uncharacterized protein
MLAYNSKRIISFTKTKLPNGYLGNMFASPIEYDGKVWRTAEALFQALRFHDDSIREMIRNEKSPFGLKLKVKSITDQMTIAPKSDQDIENMRLVIRLKFDQHPELMEQLLSTGDAIIIEDVTKRKSGNSIFWGAYLSNGHWTGENKLGEMLMELRGSKFQEDGSNK